MKTLPKAVKLLAPLLGAALIISACGSSSSQAAGSSATTKAATGQQYHLLKAGTLTVGMDLQFKPEMYLDAMGKPAGYDVELLHKLAASMGVKLNIKNIDFNGLIPGLQSKKFDLVSVGLTPTPARAKSVSFTRAYVPYALVLAQKSSGHVPARIAAWNNPSQTITALQGSSDAQLVSKEFPAAHLQTFPDDTSALLQVASGRATGAVVEDYILAEFQKSNPGQLTEVGFSKPLNVQYGSWAVQKGNTSLVTYLNKFLCTNQTDGALATIYKKSEGVSNFPPMPACASS